MLLSIALVKENVHMILQIDLIRLLTIEACSIPTEPLVVVYRI